MVARKISITLDGDDLDWLRNLAKKSHGGNLSAALTEAVQGLRRQAALERFVEKEGIRELTPKQYAAILAEWMGPPTYELMKKKRSKK